MIDYLNIYVLRIISLAIINRIAFGVVTTDQANNVANNFIKLKQLDFEKYNIKREELKKGIVDKIYNKEKVER